MMSDFTPTNSTSQGPIEWSIFQILETDVAEDDPDTMLDLIDTFVKDSVENIDNITQGIENQDLKKIEISAHSIKSTAAIFGATTLSALCAEIERLAHSEETQAIADILYLAHDEFARVQNILAAEREKWAKAASR